MLPGMVWWMNQWMNDKNLYSALKSLQKYAWSTVLSRELKLEQNRCAKEKRSGRESVRSVQSLQWVSVVKSTVEKTWGRDVFTFKSRVKKRSDWWWQRWWWQCGSDLCRVVRRWKTRMWMRLTERVREFIPKAGCCMLKRTVCNFEWWGSRWYGYGDNRRGSSTARRLNSNLFRKIRRLRGSNNFISEREKLVLMRSLIFNQCRDLITGVMWVYRRPSKDPQSAHQCTATMFFEVKFKCLQMLQVNLGWVWNILCLTGLFPVHWISMISVITKWVNR